jgi:hypothetical protein
LFFAADLRILLRISDLFPMTTPLSERVVIGVEE